MVDAAARSGRCARRVLLFDLCGAGEAGASARTVGDRCGAGRTCHRVRRNALFDGPGFPAIRGTEIGRSDALLTTESARSSTNRVIRSEETADLLDALPDTQSVASSVAVRRLPRRPGAAPDLVLRYGYRRQVQPRQAAQHSVGVRGPSAVVRTGDWTRHGIRYLRLH